MRHPVGQVTLVGGGPGDPGLITVAGLRALRRADVVIHDRLAPPELLEFARPSAEIIDAGKACGEHKITQDDVNAIIVTQASRGKRVVRLKGGDPFVFGRGNEEVAACRAAGIPCRVIPGVTSAIAGPAAAGIPITERKLARSVVFVTGRTADNLNAQEEADRYGAIAHVDTIVILMSRGSLVDSTAAILAAGRSPTTPAAAIQSASTPHQRVAVATLGDIAEAVQRAGLSAPLLVVIGDVAAIANQAPHAPGKPLAGRRIVLTRPRSTARPMAQQLRRAGATVISCPLIAISYDVDTGLLDAALHDMRSYRWMVLTSQHAVTAVRKRLTAHQLDARIFHDTHIAAVGPATARALGRLGLRADFVPTVHTGEALAAELNATHPLSEACLLYPRADIVGAALADRFRAHGADVIDVIAYASVPQSPPAWALAEIERGVDALVFASPSAVRSFASLHLARGNAKIACIGPTTGSAARQAGLTVDIQSDDHHGDALVDALITYFSKDNVRL